MTWSERFMLHISRSVWSFWTQLWCFNCSSWSLSKVITGKLMVTFHDLKWPWPCGEGPLVAIFRLRVSSLPVTRCLRVFRMVFFQKRHLSFFSHWLIMERSLNWPNIGTRISKFQDIHFIDTGTDINHPLKVSTCSGIRCSYDEHQTFSEAMTLDVTWWPDLWWPGFEIFTTRA